MSPMAGLRDGRRSASRTRLFAWGGPLKSDAARTVTPGPHHESRAKGFPHRTGRVLARFDGNVETRHIAKPDHTGRTLGDMTEGRSEAEGHRRLHTRTHRRDSLSERDQVHGHPRTMFVCDAPPLGRRPEHRIDRLTPIRPQMGRLLEHGVSANDGQTALAAIDRELFMACRP